ncbi:hypothetical protein BGX34_008370 [Mortierella sp. NVP85]|nr:hypothetical protein BGX34_008370 [Mortierella sp. NVP85]
MSFMNLVHSIRNNVPYIFLTNGGGVRETEKAEELSKKLGVPVNSDHLIVSHSPMRALVPKYKDSNVLVVGGRGSSCKHVALDYGFRNVVTPEEVHAVHPPENLKNVGKPIDAVMVFHDSVDWGRDLQLCLDALASKGGALGTVKDPEELQSTKQSVPIYFSNPDIVMFGVMSTRCLDSVKVPLDYALRRYTRYATRQYLVKGKYGQSLVCVSVLTNALQTLAGQELEYTTYGKPMTSTYKYAETLLDKIAPLTPGPDGRPPKRTVYAVGDNPYADIAGANAYGWDSVLVKTGVFKTRGYENHHEHPATTVVDHVEDAIRWIIAKEEMKKRQ